MSFITIEKDKIIDTIEKQDVFIVYVQGRNKPWLCSKNFKPVINKEANTVKYKLAEK